MSTALYDAEAASALLVPSGTTITTSTTYAGVRCHPTRLATSMWVIAVQAIAAGGTYTFVLEASPTLGGAYSVLTETTWPTGETTPHQLMVGVPTSLAAVLDPTHQYLRCRVVLGGGSPSVTFASWLAKPAGGIGLGLQAGAAVSVP